MGSSLCCVERSEQGGRSLTIHQSANRFRHDPVAAPTWRMGRSIRPYTNTMADIHSGRQAENGAACRYGQLVAQPVGSHGRLHLGYEVGRGGSKFLQGDPTGTSKPVQSSSATYLESPREAGCRVDKYEYRVLFSCLRVSHVVRAKLIDSVIVRVQMLAELEEVIVYKDRMDDPERQATQRLTWQKRYVLSIGASLTSDWTDASAKSIHGNGYCRSDQWS